ncbi:MAG: UDP-N-acetylmuramate--L-alanine ligase [Proteobacteria bacterium]|nr:UDP-N-acetylmuramate--L-alanine ligase [Pseudomonadota bacterium]
MYSTIKRIHLIGVGGIGMSGIAELLLRNGYDVSGSDLKRSELCLHLEQLGVKIHLGHQAAHVENADLVVYSSAVTRENPEMKAALEKDIPAIPRAEMLSELMRLKYGIAVAGAHGKTTTTSMIALALTQAGLDPTIVVGGRMDNFGGTNARLGSSDFMVVEADESDGSFNKLTPSIAVVTNIDREHMDHYETMAKLKKAFLSFLNKVPFYGLSVICGDDPYLRMLLPKVTRRKKTYGFGSHNHYQITQYQPMSEGTECQVRVGSDSFELKLRAPGKHNVLNAVAAIAVADELGASRVATLEALSQFQGVQRRFHKRGELNGVKFIDDYAHHPTEILATLTAARERFPKNKIRVVFQPHRFSTCFNHCDAVAVTDIYAAGESSTGAISAELLAESIARTGHPKAVHVQKPLTAIENWMIDSQPGDIIMTLGAGDLPSVYRNLFT